MKRLDASNRSIRGQIVIEAALLLVISVTVCIAVMQGLNSNEFFATLTSGPWQSLSGLIQNGVMGPPASTYQLHPNNFERVTSPRADPPMPGSGGP